MAASSFFTRLLQAPKPEVAVRAPDSIADFDAAWTAIKDTLEHPNERQLVRGIGATDVPRNLKHMVDALVYEGNRTDEDTTGACLEYFLRHDILANLERLCERDRPRGIKALAVRSLNNLVVLLSERFLVHNAVHRPLRRLLRSCVGDAPVEKVDGERRVFGAGALEDSIHADAALEEDLVDLMCILCSRMRAYPPLLLIFFHDRGWMVAHNSSGAINANRLAPGRALSPAPSATSNTSGLSNDPAMNTHFEFLLFSYLLRFVHREGRTGDFARAGLLFLFDIAFLAGEEGDGLIMTPAVDGSDPMQDARDALAEYILDGDFADVMAAGLGAAFSVLPSKVRIPNLAEQAREDPALNASGGMHIGAAEDVDPDDELMELPSSTDMDVRSQLDLLLKLLGFLQDILYRCRSSIIHSDPNARTVSATQALGPAVADAALDAVQTAFVDNVLYPSILECSSTDGSAVAVLTYLDVLLANLDYGPVLQRILDVLSDADGATPLMAQNKNRKQRKTGAMDYVAQTSPTTQRAEYFHDEGRFTLRDLILDNLRSGVPGASAASLHLLTTLLADHCKEVTPSILTQIREPAATALAHLALPPAGATEGSSPLHLATNSRDANVQEPELYGALVPRLDDAVIGGADTASGFGAYLTDAYASLEADWCWQSSRVPLQFVSDDGKPALLRVGEYDADPPQHALAPSDPMVRELFTALTHWFTASPDTNIALTGAITALARCPHRSLAGWLLYDLPATDEWAARDGVEDTGNESDSSDDAPLTSKRVLGPPMSSPPPQPALYQVLRELVRHQGRFRVSVEGFDRLLAERRQGLLFADHLEEAMSAMLEADGTPPMSPMVAPTARKGLATNIKNLWSPLRNRMVSGSTPPPPQATAATPPPPVVTPASPLIPQGSTMSTPSTPQRSRVATPLPVPSTPGLNPPAPAVLGASPPFKNHYVQTAVAELDVESVAPVHAGPWAPIVAVAVGEPEQAGDRSAETLSTTASLSAVLDNCVVLEELIKELVALITARRALGIDQVGFI